MGKTRKIELLAPAKDAAIGMEAILHGADAVYIGAPSFGARAAAANTVDDIARLTSFAHLYDARVYVALNTLLSDSELPEAARLAWALYRVGVDALIVQDMGLLELDLPPIPLHASTQMDNRTPEQVQFLAEAGFEQVVLARELSIDEIAAIHETTSVPLEVFVHGALCVSYSGQCYASQHCFGRSANRGECAQFCRLQFDLRDADGRLVEEGKHLLSLKDMNRSDDLELLLAAGASSLKIEGRLKNASYVKNVTAYYRQRLDAILKRHPEYERASSGKSTFTFTPQLNKSFNRGFTSYYLHGRTPDVFSANTPKSLGEPVGMVKEVKGISFTVAGVAKFANGDGLCYLDSQGRLQGMRINRAEGNRLFPQEMPHLEPRTPLYRNYDQDFEHLLSRPSAERKIDIDICLTENDFGFTLEASDENGNRATLAFPYNKEEAHTPQKENLRRQLSKLGNTPFQLHNITITLSWEWFIPSSVLSDWRHQIVDEMLRVRRLRLERHTARKPETAPPCPVPPQKCIDGQPRSLNYLGNVMNAQAERFYHRHGIETLQPAFEQSEPSGAALMTCRHCIRYSLGFCPKETNERTPFREPLYLVMSDGRRFRLAFDCRQCQMRVLADEDVNK
jgi:collagenase-like PrtC family protease